MSEGNGEKLSVKVPQEELEHELVIRYNVLTHEFSFDGWEGSRSIALGMLEYAKVKLLRVDAREEMAQEMARAPRIVPPRGPLV